MAASKGVRSTAGLSAIMALILVAAFGNPAYHDWAVKHAGGGVIGLFLGPRGLAWPNWTFSTSQSIHSLIANDLRAVLVVVLTYFFVLLLELAPAGGVRRTAGQIFAGWGGFIFAAAFGGLIGGIIGRSSDFVDALGGQAGAAGGAVYGLLIGWLVGLITLAAA